MGSVLDQPDLEELSRTLGRLTTQAQALAAAVAGGRAEPGQALLAAFRLERRARVLGRRLRACPDPKSPAAKRLLAAAEEAAVLLIAAVKRLRAEVAVKEGVARGE